MRKKIRLLFSFFVLLMANPAFAGGTIIENGGGTTAADVQSLQEALAGQAPLSAQEIPGMSLLIKSVLQVPAYSVRDLILSFQPQPDHLYYKVDAAFMRGPGKKILLSHAATLAVAPGQIRILPVGVPSLRPTISLLLPSFFELKSEIHAAAELGAAAWLNRNGDQGNVQLYRNLLQFYLLHPADRDGYYAFLKDFVCQNDAEAMVFSAWRFDQEHHQTLFTDPEKTKVRLKDLFGEDYALCVLDGNNDCEALLAASQSSSSLLARSVALLALGEIDDPGAQREHHTRWHGFQINPEFKPPAGLTQEQRLDQLSLHLEPDPSPLRGGLYFGTQEIGGFVLEKTRDLF
jgi:hypothetical protein